MAVVSEKGTKKAHNITEKQADQAQVSDKAAVQEPANKGRFWTMGVVTTGIVAAGLAAAKTYFAPPEPPPRGSRSRVRQILSEVDKEIAV